MNPYAPKMNEKTKVFLLHGNGNGSEVGGKYVRPCYIEGLFASNRILDLDQDKNFISQEYVVNLNLKYEVLENGDKKIDKMLSMKLVGETMGDYIKKTKSYELEFYVNPEEDDVEPDVILGRAFMKHTRSIVNYQYGEITLWAEVNEEGEVGPNKEEISTTSDTSLDTKRKPTGSYKLGDIMSLEHFTA
jgi:hypothetical protein